MWFEIWFLARGIVLENISQVLTPCSTRMSPRPALPLEIQLPQAIQSNCLFVGLLVYFTISLNDAKICLETLQGLFKGIVLVFQSHKIFFTLFTSPRDFFWVVLNPFLWIVCITLVFNMFRKISHPASLCLGHYAAYFGYVPLIVGNYLTFSPQVLRHVAEICEYTCFINIAYIYIYIYIYIYMYVCI